MAARWRSVPDRAGAGPDPPGVVGFVPGVDHSVELGEGVDFWDGDEVVASEPADLPLDAAFLVRTLDSGLAIEGFDAVVGTDSGPPVGLDPLAGEPDHARDGGLEVVVADLPGRHPAEHVEGVDVTLEEGFLPSRGTDPVHGLARVGEPKAEQRAGYELAAQADGDVAEVNLGLAARRCSCGMNALAGSCPTSTRISRRRVATYSRTIQYDTTPAPSCSSSSRSKIRFAVCRCFRGASRSERSQSSITTRYASSRESRLGGCFLSFGQVESH